MDPIVVNGETISEHQVNLEAQYHPAESWEAAQRGAAQALVVRALLLQRAVGLGLLQEGDCADERRSGAALEQLTAQQVPVPRVSIQRCRDYYESHPERFRSPDLFAVSHILLAADPQDAQAREGARAHACQLVAELQLRPERFGRLARKHSDCPSAKSAGSLGQVSPGETEPQFEASLAALDPGQLAATAVETVHGMHVVRLDDRAQGQRVPFESVSARIQVYLRDQAWRRQMRRYVVGLAEAAEIEGFCLGEALPAPAPAFRPLPVLN